MHLHVSLLNADHGTGESLELPSRQILHISVPHRHQICGESGHFDETKNVK